MSISPTKIIGNHYFEWSVTAFILITAALIGLETTRSFTPIELAYFEIAHAVLLGLFLLEIALRFFATAPSYSTFFRDPWNLYDIAIAVLSLVPWDGDYAIVGRVLRILRVVRLVARFGELRLIVGTLLKSLPSMGHILILLSLIFYVYGIMGYHSLHEVDPKHFGSLGTTMLTLFRIMTLEDWTDIMYVAMEANGYSWLYFVSFVIITSFVVVNMFVALVLSNLSEIKRDQRKADAQEQQTDRVPGVDIDDTIEQMRALVAAHDLSKRTNS